MPLDESEKRSLKLNIQKTKIMASSPITSWQIDVETVADYFLGSKIIANGYCSHEIKRCLLFGRKVMTNLDSILKSRDITLPTKVRLVKAIVFPVAMYGCESWTVKKAECWRTVVLEKALGNPLDSKEIKRVNPKGNQPWIFIGTADAEAPTLWPPDVKGWLIGKKPGCWERLRAGGEGEDRGWDGWMASPTQWTWIWANSGRWWRTGKPGVLVHGAAKSQIQFNDWTTTGSCLQLPSLWLNWSPRFDLYISCPITGISHFSREL